MRLSGSISSIKRSEREGEEKRELPEEAESGGQEGPVLFTPEVRCSERFACSPLRLMQWRPGTPLIATGAESLGRGPPGSEGGGRGGKEKEGAGESEDVVGHKFVRV